MFSLRTLNLILKEKKPVVFFLSGLPGSGKSTISKSIQTSVQNVDIVSKDDIRRDLWMQSSPDAGKIQWKKNCDGIKDRPSERLVCEERDRRILDAIANGRHVIVDDTNLNPVHFDQIKKIVGSRAIIEPMFIDTPVQKCVKRDRSRPEDQRVGSVVIYSMYNRYLKGRKDDGNVRGIRGDASQPDGDRQHGVRSDSPAISRPEEGMGRVHTDAGRRGNDNQRSESTEGPSVGKNQTVSATERQPRISQDRGRHTLGKQGPTKGNAKRATTTTGGLNDKAVDLRGSEHVGHRFSSGGNDKDDEGRAEVLKSNNSLHSLQSGRAGDSGSDSGARTENRTTATEPNSKGLVDKITFATAAERLLGWRKTLAGSEKDNGWIKNSRGIWEFSWDAPCYDLDGRFIGMLKIYYADQNPRGRSREARLVSSGKWKQMDVGWMWTIFRGRRIWLAKATPDGSSTVTNGSIVLGKDGKRHFFINL